MGYEVSTYFFYGVHVPGNRYRGEDWEETERLAPLCRGTGVGYVLGGAYDQDELFLSVVPPGWSIEIPLGEHRKVNMDAPRELWDSQLKALAEAAGYGDLGPGSWIVLPDRS